MNFGSQHLRFSVDLFSKAGHEAIVAHIEGELKHLEHARDYLVKRAKVELDYASALGRINTAACKVINDNDKESPIRKVSILNLSFILVVAVFLLSLREEFGMVRICENCDFVGSCYQKTVALNFLLCGEFVFLDILSL